MDWLFSTDKDFRYRGGHTLRIAELTHDGINVVSKMEFTSVPDGVMVPDDKPLLTGESVISFLQGAMDTAYALGLRPSQAQDPRHLEAHLRDMRIIAFKTLGIEEGQK